MEFNKSKVYTALNADELKIGSKVIVGDNLSELKENVLKHRLPKTIKVVESEDNEHRFLCDDSFHYALAYLVSVPEIKDWIVYLCRLECVKPYLTACRSDVWEEVQKKNGAKTKLFEGTEKEATDWYEARKQFTDIIAAWEDGKTIQFNSGYGWEDCCNNKPAWDVISQYRIRQEGLKWTDLKIGDIIQHGDMMAMVTIIHSDSDTTSHIYAYGWIPDEDLESWEKVE